MELDIDRQCLESSFCRCLDPMLVRAPFVCPLLGSSILNCLTPFVGASPAVGHLQATIDHREHLADTGENLPPRGTPLSCASPKLPVSGEFPVRLGAFCPNSSNPFSVSELAPPSPTQLRRRMSRPALGHARLTGLGRLHFPCQSFGPGWIEPTEHNSFCHFPLNLF